MGNKRKNPAAVTLGKLGGKARAEKLSAARRKEIATKAGVVSGKVRSERAKATSSLR